MERSGSELPGFRFHPTEEELLNYYLHRAVNGKKLNFDLIGTLNIYRHDPWDLPKLAWIGEREWYFFVPRDRKQANGRRPNRMTERGFWKATGSDRPIRCATDAKGLIGVKKTLVFYKGRAPRGFKTDWVMTEYRLPDASDSTQPRQEDIVLCKVYRKATSQKELEQRAAMEELMAPQICLPMIETTSSSNQENLEKPMTSFDADVKEMMDEAQNDVEVLTTNSFETTNFLDQIPKCSFDWMQDSFSQLHNLWLEQWSPYTDILNF